MKAKAPGRRRPFATVEAYTAYVHDCFGPQAETALPHYGAAAASGLYRAVADLFGDTQFVFGTRALARAMSTIEPHAYAYADWPWVEPAADRCMFLGDELRPGEFPRAASLDFLTRFRLKPREVDSR